MNATPASVERVQKYVLNFDIYRFVKKRPIYPILPYLILAHAQPGPGYPSVNQYKSAWRGCCAAWHRWEAAQTTTPGMSRPANGEGYPGPAWLW